MKKILLLSAILFASTCSVFCGHREKESKESSESPIIISKEKQTEFMIRISQIIFTDNTRQYPLASNAIAELQKREKSRINSDVEDFEFTNPAFCSFLEQQGIIDQSGEMIDPEFQALIILLNINIHHTTD